MTKNLPSRGPRALHGLGKMVMQAVELGPTRAGTNPGVPIAERLEQERARAFQQVLSELHRAELRCARVRAVLAQYREQACALPETHPARQLVEPVLASMEQALNLPEGDRARDAG